MKSENRLHAATSLSKLWDGKEISRVRCVWPKSFGQAQKLCFGVLPNHPRHAGNSRPMTLSCLEFPPG